MRGFPLHRYTEELHEVLPGQSAVPHYRTIEKKLAPFRAHLEAYCGWREKDERPLNFLGRIPLRYLSVLSLEELSA